MDEPQQQAGDEYDFDEEAEAVAAANAAAEQQHRLATVLSLVPDVLPSHVLDLLERFGSAQEVINELLDDDRYPRVESSVRKGKKRARSEEGDDRSGETYEQGERDWLDAVERGQTSDEYRTHALEQLFKDYDQIGKGQIRIQFEASGHLYAHAALALDDLLEQSDDERGWALLKGRRPLPKGKGKAFRGIWELDKEKTWLRKKRAKAEEEKARAEKERLEEEELDKAEQGMLVECGCCFGEFRFALLIQCSDAHLFCKECCTTNADVQIGMSKGKLSCMADDCEAPFPESEAIRFLTSKALATLAKLRQAEEIAEAALVGLESCPFCPFACVIENPEEKLLRCERPGCEAVSCRSCKKIEHLPKTCEEFAREFSLHAVEEAMSAALVRSCPKCRQSYLKITGCNYITCSNCHAGSCYVCQQLCQKSPEHFNMNYNYGPGTSPKQGSKAKCPLFDQDNSLSRDFDNIEAARKAAAARVLEENQELSQADLDKLKVSKEVLTRGQQMDLQQPMVPQGAPFQWY